MLAQLKAATITWDGDAGSGNWGTANNWSNNNAWNSGNTANFDTDLANSQYTITLGGSNRAVRNITFSSGTASQGFTFSSGNTLTINNSAGIVNNDNDTQTFNVAVSLGTAQTWNAASGGLLFTNSVTNGSNTLTLSGTVSSTISGVIGSGSGGLLKTGTGTWTLSGANTYTGTTTVSQGTLQLNANAPSGSAGALGNATSTVTINNASTGTNSTALLAGASGVTIGRNITVANQGSGTVTLGGNFASGSATFTGNVTLNRSVRLSADGTSAVTFGTGVISGAGGVTKTGTGTVILSGANTYTGTTTVSQGTLQLNANAPSGSAGALGNATSTVTINDANTGANNTALLAGASGVTIGRNITVANQGSGTVTLGGNFASGSATFTGNVTLNRSVQLGADDTSTVTFGTGVISGAGGVTKTGTGTVTLSGANTYTGATTVSTGTLKAGVASVANVSGAFGNNSAVTLANTAGATLDITGYNTQIGSLTGGGASGGNVTLGSATLTVGGNNTSPAAYAGVISGTGGGLTKIGTGTLTLSGTNTYTGVTTINAGTLSVSSIGNGSVAGNLGQATNAAGNLVLGGGTLQYTGSTAGTNRNFTLTNATTSTIEVTSAATNLTISGASAATSGGLTKTGTGTLTLSGTNLHTGTTTVNGGTLFAQGSSSLGASSGAVTVTSGTLALDGGAAITLANPTNAETITKSGMLTLAGAGTGADIGALHAAGSTGETSQWIGNITLSGNATISAADSLLRIGNGATYANTINLGSNTLTLHTSATAGVVPVNLADTTAPYDQFDATNILINSQISGTGGLTKTGAGTATLVAFPSNSFSGATLVTGGKLILDGSGNAPIISSTSVTIGNSSSPGTADSVVLQMGQLSGGLAAVNNMIGTSSSSSATTSMTIYEDGLFNLNGGSNSLINLTLQGGHVNGGDPSYSSLLTLTGQITTSASAQTAVIDGGYVGMSSNSFAVNVANGTAATDLRIDSVLQNGSGFTGGNAATSLAKTGAGTLLLTASNTYSGVTQITGGVLAIQDSAALGQGGATSDNGTVVGTGTQLQLDGSAGNLTVANESLTLTGDGTSTTGELRNTAGSNTYNGFITLAGNSRINADAGSTLTIANTLGASASIINGNAAGRELTLGGAGNIAINSVIGSNVGTLVKDGSGTATLAGNYSANAVTTVKEGTLELNMSGGGLSSATTVTIGDGVAGTATLLLAQGNQISNSASVSLGSDGVFNLNNQTETIGSIAGTGGIIMGTGQLLAGGNDASTNFSGTLLGDSTAILTKQGTGTLTIGSNVNAAPGDFAGTLNLSAGALAFNVDNAFTGTINVFAGTTLKLSDADLSITNLNFVGSGSITLDFSGTSTLNVTNLTIAAGITVNVINWTNATDYFFAQNWSSAVQDTTGLAPMNYVVFSGFSGNQTKWQSYDDQITPVPEPSSYGAMLVGAMGALLGYRRWRRKRLAA